MLRIRSSFTCFILLHSSSVRRFLHRFTSPLRPSLYLSVSVTLRSVHDPSVSLVCSSVPVRSPIRLYVCPSVRPFLCPSTSPLVRRPPVSPSTSLFARTSVCSLVRPLVLDDLTRPSICRPSVHPFVRPSVCASVRLSGRPFVRPSFRPSVRSPARPSVRPSVCPSNRPSVRPSIYPTLMQYCPSTIDAYIGLACTQNVLTHCKC